MQASIALNAVRTAGGTEAVALMAIAVAAEKLMEAKAPRRFPVNMAFSNGGAEIVTHLIRA